jgi:hypothetical protein
MLSPLSGINDALLQQGRRQYRMHCEWTEAMDTVGMGEEEAWMFNKEGVREPELIQKEFTR